MDVDLLRPGAIPMSSETVLWFEYLLNPDLLWTQLQKNNTGSNEISAHFVSNTHIVSDISPINLIIKFHEVIVETLRNKVETDEIVNIDPTRERPKDSAKTIALKIISLKVAAYLRWNISKEPISALE